MKCSVCKKKIEITFLNKIVGTYYKNNPVCKDCQLLGVEYLKKKLKKK
ncbi:MAG: hypothetical protein GON13_03020 [Nanoarchaeota archaeon]|nr:hypothetical protein [Nanoarchaeota archaeon]